MYALIARACSAVAAIPIGRSRWIRIRLSRCRFRHAFPFAVCSYFRCAFRAQARRRSMSVCGTQRFQRSSSCFRTSSMSSTAIRMDFNRSRSVSDKRYGLTGVGLQSP